MEFSGKLKGKIAVVAGATRGAGRGIACMLGEAGATVYCTGRSVRGRSATKSRIETSRTETIEETAEMVSARGGVGIHAQVDHTDAAQVKALFERVEREQGRLNLLVNDLTGDAHIEMKPFVEHSLERGLKVLENGSLSHIITSHFAVPLMIQTPGGLIIEMTDGVGDELREWNFYYDLEKALNIRLARSLAEQLRPQRIAVVALTPGFMRSEEVLDVLGVTEANWRDGIKKDKGFAYSETPFYVGKAAVALACDKRIMKKSGQTLISGKLAREYGFTDVDGAQPIWAY